MGKVVIRIAEDFSRYPAGRYENDGPYSGQRFRKECLQPVLDRGETAIIQLDGTRGYGSSFLEEAFGGLVRVGYGIDQVKNTFELQATDTSLVEEIIDYIEHGSDQL